MGLEKEISMKRRASQLSPLRRLLVLVGALIGLWSAFSPSLTDWSLAWAAETSSTVCRFVGEREVKKPPTHCKRGDIFLWIAGPELGTISEHQQRPVIAAAFYCDFSKPIVWAQGIVACIYTDTQRELHK